MVPLPMKPRSVPQSADRYVGDLETGLSPIVPTAIDPHGLGLISRYPFDQATPYSETYNLTNQYEITHNDSIQIGYVGSVSRHLISLMGDNQVEPAPVAGHAAGQCSGIAEFRALSRLRPGRVLPLDHGNLFLQLGAGKLTNTASASGCRPWRTIVFARCLGDNEPQEGGSRCACIVRPRIWATRRLHELRGKCEKHNSLFWYLQIAIRSGNALAGQSCYRHHTGWTGR